ncbi:hypothetical protein D3C87_1996030 [compost metagenome]
MFTPKPTATGDRMRTPKPFRDWKALMRFWRLAMWLADALVSPLMMSGLKPSSASM